MKELITIEQANTIMLALIVIAPIVGAALGSIAKRTIAGLMWGAGIGVGNFALWKLYNSITNNLGLDTVKNLLVNMALFIGLGVIGGLVTGLLARWRNGFGPSTTSPGAARITDAADEPPRDLA